MYAQSVVIQGIVIDKISKDAIVGASLSIKDGFDGATSDANGLFKFETEETGKQILVAAYLGYKTQEIPIDLSKPIDLKIIMEETPTAIGEVVISAGSFEASDEKKGVVLTPLDIVTVPGANGDFTGALNTLPGTTVNGETGQLIVRGGAAGETRIYIDGLAVRNFYSTGTPDVPVRSRFSPFQFKGTTFSTGGYSAEYGQALSAALSLNSPDMPTQGGTNIGVSLLGLNAGHTLLKKRSALSINAGYINLSPYMKIIKQRLEFFDPPVGGYASFEGRQKIGDLGILKYGGQGTLNKVGIGYPAAPFETRNFTMKIKNQNARGFISWRQPVNEDWTIYIATQGETNQDEFEPNTFSAFEVKNYAFSGRVNAVYAPHSLFRLKTGGEYNLLNINNSFLPNPVNHNLGAVYSEAETYITDRMVLRAGLRGERDMALERNNLAPRLSAAYKTGKDAQVSASWGVFYQSPEDTLLFRGTQIGFERAQHFILNYQIAREGRLIRIESYYKKYNNLVRTSPNFDNSGNGYAQGVEFFFRDRKTLKWGDYWLSYSFLDTKRIARDYPVSAMPTFAATHNASLVFKYFFNKPQISANMSYTVQSGRPYYNPGNPVFLGDRSPAYQNLSIQFAKLTSIKGNFTIFVLSINNVLGIKQVFNYRFVPVPNSQPVSYFRQEIGPPAPRSVFVGCFVNIGDKRSKVSKEEALE